MANFSTTTLYNSTPLVRQTSTPSYNSTPRTNKAKTARLNSNQPKDFPVSTPSKHVSGTVYGLGAVPTPNATVKLFRQLDDFLCRVSTTDAAGHYLFVRDEDDPYAYYVMAYTASISPQFHGTSDRGVVPAS